jgi:hypothetical protein
MEEKILPYLEGLDLVNKKEEAEEIRRFLTLSPDSPDLIPKMESCVTPRLIRNINEAFRGKVMVVLRDLDRLYQSLVHRKYTLLQTRKILEEWLKGEGLSADTFFHFLGSGGQTPKDQLEEHFTEFLETRHSHLRPLFQETGFAQFLRTVTVSLWIHQYGLPLWELAKILPWLERRAGRDPGLLHGQLTELAREL